MKETDNYFILLKNLDIEQKLMLISDLSNSILEDQDEKEKKFYSLCGKLDISQSVDDFLRDIRKSRCFNDR
jgi:hypothetical protein